MTTMMGLKKMTYLFNEQMKMQTHTTDQLIEWAKDCGFEIKESQ